MHFRNEGEIMTDAEYIAHEFGKAEGDNVKIKVETDRGDTRWISITRTELDRIAEILLQTASGRD